MAQMVNRRLVTAKVSEICGGHNDTVSGLLLEVSSFLHKCSILIHSSITDLT
jgi:hypothetical protein